MSRENLDRSLESVEHALQHFAASLQRAGFKEGASAYKQMAAVLVAQRLWANDQGVKEFDPRFRRVAALAEDIGANLVPYVEVMKRLTLLAELRETPIATASDPLCAGILEVLKAAHRPMSSTAIRSAVGASASAVRRELSELVERGHVQQTGSNSRPVYALAD